MSVPTSRAHGDGEVTVDHALCTRCGLCVGVCAGPALVMRDGRVECDLGIGLGCIACGQCMTVCPTGAITVRGRDLSPEDLIELAPDAERASYAELLGLFGARRSVRQYTSEPVAEADVEWILSAASSAPMGVPPSDVGVLVVTGCDCVRDLRDDVRDTLVGWGRWLRFLSLARPFMRQADYRLYRDFIIPALKMYEDPEHDWLYYDAPCVMYFYGCGACDPADPVVAATYAMLAAESLGLGTCMLGFTGYAFTYDRKLRARWGLPRRAQVGLLVSFGHPAVRHQRGVRRRFAQVVRG
ncbi:MAG: nitroreductase family protein [Coriobacteriia bacterium]